MLQTLVLKQQFLDRFAEEIILVLVKQIKGQEKFERELKRVQREVELEKMRQKFSKYGIGIVQQNQQIQHTQNKISIAQRPLLASPPQAAPRRMQPVARPVFQEKIKANLGNTDFFGKIQELINDPLITYIECPGENKNIIIRKAGVTTTTQLMLKNDEELSIIKSFSERARIPLIEGMLNARIANIEISAIVSENSGSSFIIKKNPIQIVPASPTQLQRPMMQFPQRGSQPPPQAQAMPPINRPFTPSYNPRAIQTQQQSEEKKENFWNKKVSFGK